MNSFKNLLLLCTVLLAFNACKVDTAAPLDPDRGAPLPITEVKVENLSGAVKLVYKLPKDDKLLYVKAECVINGKLVQAKASSYTNELMLEGFGEAGEYEVKIYSVSASEHAAAPLTVKVHPTKPPYEILYQTVTLNETFGGASVGFKNPTEADMVIEILVMDDFGDWTVAETYYTKKLEGSFAARGFKAEATKFGVHIKDRWDNRSDTLVKDLVPLFEKQLDRTKFQQVVLPTDQASAWGWVMPYIWDGIIVNNTNIDKPGFHTNPAPGQWPQWFSFSLGVKSKLSRFKFWQRGSWVAFTDRNMKKFEIWGSNAPAPDGSWDSWTKLMDCESVKPSGLPLGKNSAEDLALVGAGEEFTFPDNTPAVKFIRIKVLETWGGAESFYVMQVGFWGANE